MPGSMGSSSSVSVGSGSVASSSCPGEAWWAWQYGLPIASLLGLDLRAMALSGLVIFADGQAVQVDQHAAGGTLVTKELSIVTES